MLILGSSSPRRSMLLTKAGVQFAVLKPDIDETPRAGESPVDYVLRLSREKATAIRGMADLPPEVTLILSADTTVADQGEILGKPDDADQARAMLQQLRGHAHEVHTGVTVLRVGQDGGADRIDSSVVTTRVRMRDYTDTEIEAYIESGDPFGKAGSYAIQNADFHPVESMQTCYTNVVGLPVCIVGSLLASAGLTVPTLPPCMPGDPRCAWVDIID